MGYSQPLTQNDGNILRVLLFPKFPEHTFAAVNAEQQLIEQVMRLFMRYGIKSLTMDDIARKLGVSKKTIYKYVSDKNDLVRRAMEHQIETERFSINSICEAGTNAIDEIFEISKIISEILGQVHPSVHYDLGKYHPEVWNVAMKQRQDHVYECVFGNLNKGKEEGLYREDLNCEVIAKIYIAKLDVLFDGEIFSPQQFNFADVYLEFFRYHVRGIASPKGLEYLIEKVKKQKANK